jgi:hypothetical protein
LNFALPFVQVFFLIIEPKFVSSMKIFFKSPIM